MQQVHDRAIDFILDKLFISSLPSLSNSQNPEYLQVNDAKDQVLGHLYQAKSNPSEERVGSVVYTAQRLVSWILVASKTNGSSTEMKISLSQLQTALCKLESWRRSEINHDRHQAFCRAMDHTLRQQFFAQLPGVTHRSQPKLDLREVMAWISEQLDEAPWNSGQLVPISTVQQWMKSIKKLYLTLKKTAPKDEDYVKTQSLTKICRGDERFCKMEESMEMVQQYLSTFKDDSGTVLDRLIRKTIFPDSTQPQAQ